MAEACYTARATTKQQVLDGINKLTLQTNNIGAKEGIVEAVSKLVGSDITDAILRTPDGSDHKSINDFTLYEVMKVAIDGADRPNTNDVLEQLIKVINHPFDFCKVSVNMELMQSNAARMATYGIVIGIPQLTLTLLVNIETATKSDYGREFRSAMHAIRKKYAYNHVHDVASLQTILTELVGADGVRTLRDAPAPNAGTAHSVANLLSFLNSMMPNSDTNSEYTESAYGASSDSGSSEEQRKSRERKNKKPKKAKMREKKKKEKDKDDEPKKNTCPHCKNYHRKKPHRIEPDKCMWNKKYKGYRFKSICDELEVDFKPCIKFVADLGGYTEKDYSGSE